MEFWVLTRIKFQVYREIEVKNFDASLYETEQVFYASKDGTKIPMFIVHKKVRSDL
jgi:prolyl oligopeptidase